VGHFCARPAMCDRATAGSTVLWLLVSLLAPRLVAPETMVGSNMVLLPLALYNGNPLVIDGVEQQLILTDGEEVSDALANFCT
jgi:hypothetical protein